MNTIRSHLSPETEERNAYAVREDGSKYNYGSSSDLGITVIILGTGLLCYLGFYFLAGWTATIAFIAALGWSVSFETLYLVINSGVITRYMEIYRDITEARLLTELEHRKLELEAIKLEISSRREDRDWSVAQRNTMQLETALQRERKALEQLQAVTPSNWTPAVDNSVSSEMYDVTKAIIIRASNGLGITIRECTSNLNISRKQWEDATSLMVEWGIATREGGPTVPTTTDRDYMIKVLDMNSTMGRV